MTFSIEEGSFKMNGKNVFLNSGEIHYFRIQRNLWTRHLEAAKEAGLTTISSYVPWAWHETKESAFDFDGSSSPERDLKGWLRLCKDLGLTCILKPGPFILAEYRGAGLPDWFLERHRNEVKMRDREGRLFPSDGVSLFNQDYLKQVSLWYDEVMPLISDQQISCGGPVIMMQICNEIGVFSWLAKQGDYGNAVKEKFIAYLSRKFTTIAEINRLWGTAYDDFTRIALPPDGRIPYTSKGDRSRDYEWHCFWRTYYGDYLRMLTTMARERGVTVPLYHNLPGWIYGNGYEFPVNITMYEDLFLDKSEIVFGVDHIPEFFSYRNMHDDRIINDVTQAMQGNKPMFAAEFQSGSREFNVVTNPREMEFFYKASIANGLTGWNYYMFSQGRNPRKKGYSGDTFYWFTPLTAEGERNSAFPMVKRMNRIVKTSEAIIVDARRKAEVCVLFYPPYYATELERPVDGKVELLFTASSIRRPAYFDGLLKALQVLNIDYDMTDLSKTSAEKLLDYKQVWAFSTDEMNGLEQQTIVDYITSGGNCVLFPHLPDRENSQQPCTIIRDALSVSPSGHEFIDSPLIDIFDLKDIKCANPLITYSEETLSGTEIIARTIRGSACGFKKIVGKGTIIHLGTWIGFDTEAHIPVYEAFLKQSTAKLRQASSDNNYLTVKERFTDQGTAMLFVGNYYNEEQEGKIFYTHPMTGEVVTIPYADEQQTWPAIYGLLTPICMKVAEDLQILHCTSDILDVAVTGGLIVISLYGDRDLPGEIVFEGINVGKMKSATIFEEDVIMTRDKWRTVFKYRHLHRKELMLHIKTE